MIWKKIPLLKGKKEGQEKKKLVRRGVLRRRWLVNTLVTTFAIVAIAVSAFSLAIYNYYLATILATLESKAQTAAGMFQNYTETTYLYAARQFINQFEEKTTIEVQFLTPDGEVLMTSLMDISGATPQGQDIVDAISTKTIATWRGEDTSTRDYVMAASAPIVYNGSVVGVVRLVTSLRLLQAQMLKVVGMSVLVGMIIIVLMVVYASYFIRMILEPVTRVTETAKRIAAGSYGVQMEVRGDDEMGQLVDAINDMSLKIDQAEKTQSEFISSVSHELRTPLTAINGWAETLYNGEVRDAEGAGHHPVRGPAADQHGGGAAGVLPHRDRAVQPVRGAHRHQGGAGGCGVHLPGVLPPQGVGAQLHRVRRGVPPHQRRPGAAAPGVLQPAGQCG